VVVVVEVAVPAGEVVVDVLVLVAGAVDVEVVVSVVVPVAVGVVVVVVDVSDPPQAVKEATNAILAVARASVWKFKVIKLNRLLLVFVFDSVLY
jgi:hypothetical protein